MESEWWPSLSLLLGNREDGFGFVRSAYDKLRGFIFEERLDNITTYDMMLLYSFVTIFCGFIVAAVFAFFEKDQRSLQDQKSKVKCSMTSIGKLASALGAIREMKFKSITFDGYLRIMSNKRLIEHIQASDIPPEAVVEDIKEKVEEEAPKKASQPRSNKRIIRPRNHSSKSVRGKELHIQLEKMTPPANNGRKYPRSDTSTSSINFRPKKVIDALRLPKKSQYTLPSLN